MCHASYGFGFCGDVLFVPVAPYDWMSGTCCAASHEKTSLPVLRLYWNTAESSTVALCAPPIELRSIVERLYAVISAVPSGRILNSCSLITQPPPSAIRLIT